MAASVKNTKLRRGIDLGIGQRNCVHYIVGQGRLFLAGGVSSPAFLESAKLKAVRAGLFELAFHRCVRASARCLGCIVFLLVCARLSHGAPPQGSAAAQQHAERGRQSMGRGELKIAEAELRQAVELAPKEGEYAGLLGIVLGMQQKLQESDIYLEKALRLDPGDSATRRNLGWNQFQLGQLQPAKTNLERVLQEKPHDAAATLVLGMIHEELRDYDTALRLLESVPDQVRERPESMVALARSYYYMGREQKAREALKALQLRPGKPEEMFLAGQVAAELHDFEGAASVFQSISATYAEAAKVGYNLALAQYRAKRFPESLATLRRLTAAGHRSSEIHNLLGWCLYQQDDFKAAVAALDQAIAADPADETNYLDVGMMLLERHLHGGAMAAADKALEVAPDSYRAHRLKGLVEFKLGRVNDAESLYTRAVELNPNDAQAIVALATTQLDKGDPRKAEQTLKNGIARLPRAAILYQGYGSMLLWDDRSDAAVESHGVQLLRMAVALDASLAEPHYQLGKLALRQDRNREALEELETAVKLDPKSSKNHYALAQVYRRLGRAQDAARQVQLFQSLKSKEERTFSSVAEAERATRPEP